MARRLHVHPTTPQPRLLGFAAETLAADGVIIYPTDSTYALGCALGTRDALRRIQAIRRDAQGHYMTLVCRDLSELATYARVENQAYRLLRSLTPGPYTFILAASREIPKRLLDPKRKTIGLRIPSHPVTRALLETLGGPLLSATLTDPDLDMPLADPDDIEDRYSAQVDTFLDAGYGGTEPTTVIDLSGEEPVLVRSGKGDVERVFGPDFGAPPWH
ncbi:MAG: threonylcarbamoyl-AMP synthase [Gammaproteobacteria bacterium]|nr:threonylcarbamoyl-AMP synthase [Gammaproteobacteria bacterium]MBI5617003.1 threonylcarbamoyl-AMP synthase [Gammaproteobacteria bacterium]